MCIENKCETLVVYIKTTISLKLGGKMKLKEEIYEIFETEKSHQFATSTKNGIPNICNIGGKYIREDDKIIIIDNYMKKTMENLQENHEVSILIRREKESYQLKGTAIYLTQGDEYIEAYKWMKSKGEKYPAKGAIVVTIHSVYNSFTGENAGEKIHLAKVSGLHS